MDKWIVLQVNHWAGWGYWPDYLAFYVGEYCLAIIAVPLLVRWFRPADNLRHERHVVLLAILGGLLAAALSQIPARVIFRPRPFLALPGVFDLLGRTDLAGISSFPSAHAASVFAPSAVLGWRSRWGWATWPLAVLIALSRVYAGVHYPTDMLAGSFIGVATALFLLWLAPDLEPALDRILGLRRQGTKD